MARSAHTDNTGEPFRYESDFKGPLQNRSCTDILCLLLFIVFIGCWIGVGTYAFVSGDPDKLLIPRDSSGSRCGYDAHVLNKRYLFFFDLTKCINPTVAFTGCNTSQVCVESCPTTAYFYPDLNVNAADPSQTLICTYDVSPKTPAEAEAAIEADQCAKWALPSQPVLYRCIPGDLTGFNYDIFNGTLDAAIVDKARESLTLLSRAEQIGYDVVQDIITSWKEILLGVGISIVFCLLYIFVLRWIAGVIVWLSILGALAALGFCVYWSTINYLYYKNEAPNAHEEVTNTIEAAFKKSTTWLVLLIIFAILLAVLLLVVIFLRKRIVLATALIKEGSKAVGACTAALFFPIVPWILQLGVIAYTLAVAIYISTVGDPLYEIRNYDATKCYDCVFDGTIENGQVCDIGTFACRNVSAALTCEARCRFIQTSNVGHVIYLHIFNGVGLFWGVFFVSALCEMILAGTFATWYWTFKKSKVPFFTVTASVFRTLRYHIGTLAFGSLIITICRIIRLILEYIDAQLKKYENPVTRAILCCCKCFFWCLESFLRFINKNAYIMCAIHGRNFCVSAKDAFSLLMRNILRVFVLDKITDFIFFLSKLIVVVGVSATIYAILIYVSTTQLTYIYVPVIFVAFCAFLVSHVFFKVYTMAIDTLFLCFLEDCERNDGSPDRPYFMSKSLMGVLNKKNK